MKRLILVLIIYLAVPFGLILEKNQMVASAKATIDQSEADGDVYLPLVLKNTSFIKWAFEETFDGDPVSPSQDLLPANFDYVVTHRTTYDHFRTFSSYLADHDDHCVGPNPSTSPLPQHQITTSHESNGASPDHSFFICKDHMMSSMGDVEGYSVTSFWPRQEFDFSNGGYLEFDININQNHPRSWFEILIAPRSELKVGAAPWWLPIDEGYPKDRIALRYFYDYKRSVQVGSGGVDPAGVIVEKTDWANWADRYPNDPALTDRRIRRKMRIQLTENQIIWSIEKANGSFDDYVTNVPGGLPFTRGLVVFKTHAYTPEKDGNKNNYTFHWDNIRFSGPVVGRYESFDANDVVYLQKNGNRTIGEHKTVLVDLPYVGTNPTLFGQVHSPMAGQVLLSVNGRPNIVVHPYDYNPGTCSSTGWKSFQLNISPSWLKAGSNTFKWTIGPKPNCAESWLPIGFSIKDFEVQFDKTN